MENQRSVAGAWLKALEPTCRQRHPHASGGVPCNENECGLQHILSSHLLSLFRLVHPRRFLSLASAVKKKKKSVKSACLVAGAVLAALQPTCPQQLALCDVAQLVPRSMQFASLTSA